jgi:SAM-dependent methyltransferase
MTLETRDTTRDAADRARTDDWDAHWSEYNAANALNPASAYRTRMIFELLALATAAGPVRLLDLGCGQGELAVRALAARPNAEVLGLDLSSTGVAIAQKKVPRGHFFQQDFTQPMALDRSYDGWATHAVCSEVLEHLDDPAAMLRNVRRLLAPGCRLVITVPGGPMSAFDKHIGHRGHFTCSRLEQTLRDAGLLPVDVRGAGFPFFNLYRLAVVARGRKLIEEAGGGAESALPATARAMLRVFDALFKLNASKTRLGWQLVAVATQPG